MFRQQQDGSNGFHRIEAKLRGEQNSDGAAGTAACCRAARQNNKSELRVESLGSGWSLRYLFNEGRKVGIFFHFTSFLTSLLVEQLIIVFLRTKNHDFELNYLFLYFVNPI